MPPSRFVLFLPFLKLWVYLRDERTGQDEEVSIQLSGYVYVSGLVLFYCAKPLFKIRRYSKMVILIFGFLASFVSLIWHLILFHCFSRFFSFILQPGSWSKATRKSLSLALINLKLYCLFSYSSFLDPPLLLLVLLHLCT